MAALAVLLWTWLLAGIPFGLVITTLYGDDRDLRAVGSGNIGATNVARVHGWRLAGPVLALDIGKGLLPVLVARLLWPDAGLAWLGLVGMVAFFGHCFSVYLEFRGGKGVATSAGALLGIVPGPTLGAVAVWVALLGLTGRSSVAALGSALGLVGIASWVTPHALPVVVVFALGIAATHTPNIRRLVRGEEAEVVRPVRWGRREGPSPAELLDQPPAGKGAAPGLWREPAIDPLSEE